MENLQPVRELTTMGPGSARIVASGGDLPDGAFAVPGAGSPGQAKRFVLAAAAGVALAVGAVTGTSAAHAAAVVSARPAAAVHAHHPRLRSEEHTSELQSHVNLVCRLLLEKKKKKKQIQ